MPFDNYAAPQYGGNQIKLPSKDSLIGMGSGGVPLPSYSSSKKKEDKPGVFDAIYNFIDIPGSMVKDAISFSNPFDQLHPANWFNDKNRTTGAQISRYWAGGDENSAGNQLAGMVIDTLADPFFLFSGGTSAAAKLGAKGAKSALKGIGKVGSSAGKGYTVAKEGTFKGKLIKESKDAEEALKLLQQAGNPPQAQVTALTDKIKTAEQIKEAAKSNPNKMKDFFSPLKEAVVEGGKQGFDSMYGGIKEAGPAAMDLMNTYKNNMMAGNPRTYMQTGVGAKNALGTATGQGLRKEPTLEEMITQALLEDPELAQELLYSIGGNAQ